jgi:hypothetical protein
MPQLVLFIPRVGTQLQLKSILKLPIQIHAPLLGSFLAFLARLFVLFLLLAVATGLVCFVVSSLLGRAAGVARGSSLRFHALLGDELRGGVCGGTRALAAPSLALLAFAIDVARFLCGVLGSLLLLIHYVNIRDTSKIS